MKFYTWVVKEEMYLHEWFKSMHVSSNKMNYLIDNGCCFVSSKRLKRDDILKINDYLFIDLSNYEQNNIKTYKYPLKILYENDYIIVIDKPSGFIVHSDGVSTAPTVQDMVMAYLKEKNEDSCAFPAHRLDKDTTGCLLFCKDIITLSYYSNLFQTSNILKTYYAMVEGIFRGEKTVNMPIGKDRHVNGKMVATPKGLPATSIFKSVKVIKNFTLVKVSLKSGRTHQIRVHASLINHPLVGDSLYGSKTSYKRILLHSYLLSFIEISSGKKIEITAKLPNDLDNFCIFIAKKP